MRELFIYYKVRSSDAAAARQAVLAMQRELQAAHPGLEARLLHRTQGDGDGQTWLETYSRAEAGGERGVGGVIESAIEAGAAPLAPFFAGPRHLEAFILDDPDEAR